ncbi:MAG: hydrolase, partial [Acidimicrobiia bacterium]|nr:hydrolase [Acidimicrobiia bacterium]
MPYAEGRTFLDADSHIMELPNFLRDHADPAMRDLVPRLAVDGGDVLRDRLSALDETGGHSPETVEELLALGDGLIAGPKGYDALGAFDTGERSQALDLLGFHNQWVFASFSAGHIFYLNDPEVMAASATAHNRGMAEFCAPDSRLWGVGATPLDDPDAAMAELQRIIDLGLMA